MKILVVGSGAREDALSWRLAASASCTSVCATPGNAGTASRGDNWGIAITDSRKIVERSKSEGVDFAVIGPETAIAAGLPDRLREAGIPVFGPGRSIGRLESSKVFAKRFMQTHRVPTARARVVHSIAAARKELKRWNGACVVKADGLAAGKGVVVCDTPDEALAVAEAWYATGLPGGGNDIVLEERLIGREVSVFAIGDGSRFVPVAAACDYKRAFDGDAGPNTGGMGAYSPPWDFPADLMETVERSILAPVAAGLVQSGDSYRGILYCGIMWTKNGPSVLEFNVRFGDPETQALMPRVRGDFAAWLKSAADGALDAGAADFDGEPCVAVVIAGNAYPLKSEPVSGLPQLAQPATGHVFWGPSARKENAVDVSGGRVLTVAATGADLTEARERAYEAVSAVSSDLPAAFRYRTDIAQVPAPRTTPAERLPQG
jgi:phosphoribosylamine--glycine ligase